MSFVHGFLGSMAGLIACVAIAVLGAYLIWAHIGHVLSHLPYVNVRYGPEVDIDAAM